MAKQTLAVKYRPKSFEDVVEQQAIKDISPVHLFKHTVVTALERQMKVFCNLITSCHSIEQFLCAILGMRGHKADYKVTLKIVYLLQKLREIDLIVKTFAV